ncbi:MAG: hypothetical protein IJQ63_03855 [Synergistaceae bacterium]|nr:hypothetical protein [Synergistaceae bacterium]
MENKEYVVLMEQARKCAQQVGRLYMDWYKDGSFSKELSEKETDFLSDTDFRAGLAPCLFWEFKRLKLWNSIDDNNWDISCDLAMKSAWYIFQELKTQK